MSRNTTRKKIRRYNTLRILTVGLFFIFITVGTLYSVEKYSNPNLEGKWKSEETGEVIKFTKKGTIELENGAYFPKYTVLTPNKMKYTIDDKDFMMQYEIEGRILKWGLEGQDLEEFKRD